jgi:DNA-binding NarL/FixJ family response regulator
MADLTHQATSTRPIDHPFDRAAARQPIGGAEINPLTTPLSQPPQQQPTPREIEVLQLIAEGLANHEIGKALFLSEETVKTHIRHLLAKLQARSRAHAVTVGFKRALIT